MKTLVLWYGFVKKNIFPMLITSLMLAVSMFTLVTFYGKYEYTAYSRDILLDSDLRNGGYLMIYHDDEAIRDPEKMTERALKIKETVSAHPACKYILTTDSFVSSLRDDKMAGYNCFLYDENMVSGFGLRTDSGRWLTNSSDIIEGVIIGNTYERKVGDVVELDNGISVKIVGIVDTHPIYPDFGRYSNYKCPASSLFSNGNDILVISESSVPASVKDKINYQDRYKNCYVVFDDDAAESEKIDLISYMESNGIFASYECIIEDSDREIDMWLRQALPLPLFLLLVCTLSIICICTVVIKRSMNEYSRYYLLGCTKKKSVFTLSVPMVIFFGIPCLVNLADIAWFPHFLRAGSRTMAVDYLIDGECALFIFAYFAVMSAFMLVIPFLFYSKYSPLDLYRRNM